MAKEKIEIVVTEKGAAKVTKNIKGIGTGATTAHSSVSALKGLLASLITVAALKKVQEYADTYTNIQNRLKIVTKNTAELNVVTKELFAIANRTRSSFEGTAEVYARTALALKDVGVSQRETLQFSESLNQAIILSGASATEAHAGMIQLSQGLASNRLSGDELRSVLEQLPAVADVIAKHMGITRGELRKMGEDGKITAKIVLDAFKAARGELAEKFVKTVPTISQAFQRLQNNTVRYVGELDKANGASAVLAKTIVFLADNLDALARLALAAGIAIGVGLAQRGIASLTLAIRALSVAIIANPLGALLKVAIVVGSLLIAFADKFTLAKGSAATFMDFLAVSFELMQDMIGTAADFLKTTFGGAFEFLFGTFNETQSNFGKVMLFLARGADAILGHFKGSALAIVAIWNGVPGAISDLFIQAINGAIATTESGVNRIIDVINPIIQFAGGEGFAKVALGQLENNSAGAAEQLGKTIKDSYLKGLDVDVIERNTLGLFDKANERANKRLADEAKAKKSEEDALKGLSQTGVDKSKPKVEKTKGLTFDQILADLQTQNKLLQLNTREREIASGVVQIEEQLKRKLSETEKGLVANLIEENRKLEEQSTIYDEIRGPQENFQTRLYAVNQLLEKGKINLEEYNQKLVALKLESLQTSRTMEGGLQRGLLTIGQQFGDVSRVAEETVVNAFGAAEDALVSFATTGKANIKDMADSIFKDLTRLAIRQAITGPLANSIGTGAAGGGGSLGFLSGLFGNNAAAGAGGLGLPGFKDGTEFQVGGQGGPDSQLVAFKATPDETVKVIPPGKEEGSKSGGRPIMINFNISTPDADSFKRSQSQIMARAQASLNRANARNN